MPANVGGCQGDCEEGGSDGATLMVRAGGLIADELGGESGFGGGVVGGLVAADLSDFTSSAGDSVDEDDSAVGGSEGLAGDTSALSVLLFSSFALLALLAFSFSFARRFWNQTYKKCQQGRSAPACPSHAPVRPSRSFPAG